MKIHFHYAAMLGANQFFLNKEAKQLFWQLKCRSWKTKCWYHGYAPYAFKTSLFLSHHRAKGTIKLFMMIGVKADSSKTVSNSCSFKMLKLLMEVFIGLFKKLMAPPKKTFLFIVKKIGIPSGP